MLHCCGYSRYIIFCSCCSRCHCCYCIFHVQVYIIYLPSYAGGSVQTNCNCWLSLCETSKVICRKCGIYIHTYIWTIFSRCNCSVSCRYRRMWFNNIFVFYSRFWIMLWMDMKITKGKGVFFTELYFKSRKLWFKRNDIDFFL